VLSIGRRSEKTHQALLRLADEEGLFYHYDTIDGLLAYDIEQHRRMMANFLKRTRYFLVNPGKINKPEETGGLVEFGYRYFEGAAPGTIMVGEIPKNQEFPKIFHWDDAVIEMPFDSENIGSIIKELDQQPERQMNIRRNNITQVLLHHDWAHRWETVLQIAGLEQLPALTVRKEELNRRAEMAQEDRMVAQQAGRR
jgi:spore maturation protein CgeB